MVFHRFNLFPHKTLLEHHRGGPDAPIRIRSTPSDRAITEAEQLLARVEWSWWTKVRSPKKPLPQVLFHSPTHRRTACFIAKVLA